MFKQVQQENEFYSKELLLKCLLRQLKYRPSSLIKKFLFRQVSFPETVAIVLVLIVALYIIFKDSLTFLIATYSLLVGSALILLYLLFYWKRLSKNTRLGSIVSVIVWLALMYGLVHARG